MRHILYMVKSRFFIPLWHTGKTEAIYIYHALKSLKKYFLINNIVCMSIYNDFYQQCIETVKTAKQNGHNQHIQ